MSIESPEQLPPGQRRSFTWVELFFMFLCLVLPGVLLPVFKYVAFLWGVLAAIDSEDGKMGIREVAIPFIAFLAFVAACSWFAGVLVAAKSGEERRGSRTAKSAGLIFLSQILLAPAIGWLTEAFFGAIS